MGFIQGKHNLRSFITMNRDSPFGTINTSLACISRFGVTFSDNLYYFNLIILKYNSLFFYEQIFIKAR